MSDENNNGRNPPPGGRPPLSLKPRGAGSVSAGTVKQSFSHGRSKTVVVETKRARTHMPGGGNLAAPSSAEKRLFEPRPAAPAAPRPGRQPRATACPPRNAPRASAAIEPGPGAPGGPSAPPPRPAPAPRPPLPPQRAGSRRPGARRAACRRGSCRRGRPGRRGAGPPAPRSCAARGSAAGRCAARRRRSRQPRRRAAVRAAQPDPATMIPHLSAVFGPPRRSGQHHHLSARAAVSAFRGNQLWPARAPPGRRSPPPARRPRSAAQ